MLLGDREFIGERWLKWLEETEIPFIFRLKENGQYLSNSRGKMVKINALLHPLSKGGMVSLGVRKVGKLEKQPYPITALRNKQGELVVLIHSASVQNPMQAYKKRWEIETMFKAFKSSGFNMEATHLVDYDRLNTLFSVMAIAFCIAYQAGTIVAETEPIHIKSHGRKAKSILRQGLDTLQNLCSNFSLKYQQFKSLLTKILKINHVAFTQI